MYFKPNELHKTRSFTKTNEMMLKLTFCFHFPLIPPYLKTFFITFNVDNSCKKQVNELCKTWIF
jgi:hypothetical protein